MTDRPHAPFDPSDDQITEAAFHAAMRDVRAEPESQSPLAAFPVTIYALVDPRSGKVCYVGRAIDAEERFRQHCDVNRWTNNRELKSWVMGLKAEGRRPELVILSGCPDEDEADRAEIYHIKRFKEIGQATFNRAPGGRSNRSRSKIDSATPEDFHALLGEIKALRERALELNSLVGQLLPASFMTQSIAVATKLGDLRAAINAYLSIHRPAWGRVGGPAGGEG